MQGRRWQGPQNALTGMLASFPEAAAKLVFILNQGSSGHARMGDGTSKPHAKTSVKCKVRSGGQSPHQAQLCHNLASYETSYLYGCHDLRSVAAMATALAITARSQSTMALVERK